MTWSQFVGILTGPIALLLLLLALVVPKWRNSATQWTFILLWPWDVFMWAVGIAVCLSAWGWFGLAALLLLSIFFKAKAAWVGIVAAFVSGESQLGMLLLAVVVARLVVKAAAVWLVAKAVEPIPGQLVSE